VRRKFDGLTNFSYTGSAFVYLLYLLIRPWLDRTCQSRL